MVYGFQNTREARPGAVPVRASAATSAGAGAAAAVGVRRTATEENPSAVAVLVDEWRVVREAIARLVMKYPGAQEDFLKDMTELSGKIHSPEWETFFL